jgi:hypothetical protein
MNVGINLASHDRLLPNHELLTIHAHTDISVFAIEAYPRVLFYFIFYFLLADSFLHRKITMDPQILAQVVSELRNPILKKLYLRTDFR